MTTEVWILIVSLFGLVANGAHTAQIGPFQSEAFCREAIRRYEAALPEKVGIHPLRRVVVCVQTVGKQLPRD